MRMPSPSPPSCAGQSIVAIVGLLDVFWTPAGTVVWASRARCAIMDAVYGAKSSVWVMTDDFANEGLRRLQTKASQDFDIRVITGPNLGNSSSALTREFQRNTDDVWKREVPSGRVPTLVFVDVEPARDGRYYPAQVFIVSHDLYSSARFFKTTEVVTSQLIDGTLWVVNDPTHMSQELTDLVGLWNDTVDAVGGQ